jgi:hypothetical protein
MVVLMMEFRMVRHEKYRPTSHRISFVKMVCIDLRSLEFCIEGKMICIQYMQPGSAAAEVEMCTRGNWIPSANSSLDR